jgi:hypothetical protein
MLNRALAVAHMHLVDRVTLFVMPFAICASAFVLNIVLWMFVPVDGRNTGAASSLHFFVLAAAVLAVLRGLPFALGMGASRRAFVLGTSLTGLVLAGAMGTALAILRRIEEVSNGWGRQGHFFDFPWMHQSSWFVVWVMLMLSIGACFAVGALMASIWARFGMVSLVIGGPIAVLVFGGLAVLTSVQHWWGNVWTWFGDQTPLATSGWLVLLVLATTGLTWTTLRRVTAR